jgi:hypothetical protein
LIFFFWSLVFGIAGMFTALKGAKKIKFWGKKHHQICGKTCRYKYTQAFSVDFLGASMDRTGILVILLLYRIERRPVRLNFSRLVIFFARRFSLFRQKKHA